MRTSKRVLLYAMICIALHKILEFLLLYCAGKSFSDVSVICWYTFWGYELRLLAGLKRVEVSSPYATPIPTPNANISGNGDAAE